MRILAAEEYAGLSRDLREHRCAHMALASGPRDKLAELLDAPVILADPLLDSIVDIAPSAAPEELDAQLFEVAGKAGREQSFPLVRRDEAGNLLLGPVESERFTQTGVSPGCLELVEFVVRRERCHSEHSVELVQPDEAPHDIVARTKRDQP